jgi:hypothetical protein
MLQLKDSDWTNGLKTRPYWQRQKENESERMKNNILSK